MTKNKQIVEKTEEVVVKYSKEAFLDASKDSNERLLLNVLLIDGQSYSKEHVATTLKDWKSKELKDLKPKEDK
ncbi:hypothetical protein HMPREF1210_01138 [Paenisporosarcina sp. HGH0030]|uniref:hypothetical protein n=1 Tax=Paenisporosarcina sp. HGH0030 TaxID=1078085 RepID=UPI00034E500B|nr:hypothetical protein [Paenisporosarcina sp. HGH0030]EPD52758.1 hypothetical protein HMPREF1210_01138 [Paenisporosarcina sp. HGH0030]